VPGSGRVSKEIEKLGALCREILEGRDKFSEKLSVFEHRARLLIEPVYGRPFGAAKRSPKILLNAREIREAMEKILIPYGFGRAPTAADGQEDDKGRIHVHIHVPRPVREGEAPKAAISASLRALPSGE
jgi:hypothetical protein